MFNNQSLSLELSLKKLSKEFYTKSNELSKQYEVELIIDNSIVSVISQEIRKYKNIGKIFEIAQNYNIILTSYSSNDMTLSWVINSNKSIDFAQNLHNYIF